MAMPALLVAVLPFLFAPKFSFFAEGPYDVKVPTPESVLGYGPGTRHSTYREQELTVTAIATKAGAKVREFPYGRSVEGRPLRVFAISTPKNIARLDTIRKQMAELNEGKGSVPADLPAIVWVNETIHGNETASFESGMWLMYNLAASTSLEKVLDKVIVIYNPVYNPDGHERFVVWFNSIARGDADPGAFEQREPGLIHGRTNHYRFDMNRDRIAMSQAESIQEVAEFLRWTPQVYMDQHGQVDTYFFPPNALSQNVNVDRKRLDTWNDFFGRAAGAAFDKQGWPYFIRETFDAYYPGYLDMFTTLSGAIGMTHETDGGRMIRRTREDGSELTLRDGMEKHFTSALAVIRASSQNREALLNSWASFKRTVNSGAMAGKFQRVVVTSEDPRPLRRLANQLGRMGIRFSFAKGFEQPDAHDYWSGKVGKETFPDGSLVIDMNQPQGALAKSMLEAESNFEPEFLKEQLKRREQEKKKENFEGYEFYDLTGWSLPYAHGLNAWWCESRPAISSFNAAPESSAFTASTVGYLIRYRDLDDVLAAFRLAARGVRLSLLTKETKIDGKTFAAGTFQVLKVRNNENVEQILTEELRGTAVHSIKSGFPDDGRQSPGSENVRSLAPPKVAMIWGETDRPTGYGAAWYLMDEVFKLPFTALPKSALAGKLDAYTVVICPSGTYDAPSDRLKEWIQSGGCLVLLGNSRLSMEKSFVGLDSRDGASLPGTLFRAQLNARSALSYGYPDGSPIAISADGSRFLKTGEAGSVVTIPDKEGKNLLSGWSWPDETEKDLRGTSWVLEQRLGQGKVVFFAQDPTERAMWQGQWKLFVNSLFFAGL